MSEVKTFYVAGFQIDLPRSVVVREETEVQVEPKVLKVLLLLAQRQNEVVTHQEIMSHVWQGTEVVPNALQRCIAILRKVLCDDAKSPTIIATHPRIGYRLLAEVSWQPCDDKANEVKKEDETNNAVMDADKNSLVMPLLVLLVVLCLVVVSRFLIDTQPKQFTQIQQITRTDAHESHAIFSPNANYIVFNRYAGACKSHLWARDLNSGKESQLTLQAGYFGAPSFTEDGRELVFAARAHCDNFKGTQYAKMNEAMCWSIATIDFAHALSASQQPSFRYLCQADKLVAPHGLPNHQYAFLQRDGGRYQLMHYDDLTNALTSLYSSNNEYLYWADYDPVHRRFAVMSRDSDSNHIVTVLNEQGQLQSRQKIAHLSGVSPSGYFYGSFEPSGEHLLAVSQNQLYRIELNGQLQLLKTPEANLASAVQHPSKSALLAVRGNKDIDIAQVVIGKEAVTNKVADLNSVQLPFKSLARTSAQERNAQYQPGGEHIAFISNRSGQDQIWLWHAQREQAHQLSTELSQGLINNVSWSPDGKRLAWTANGKLAILDLQGNQVNVTADKLINSVLAWHQENQLLVLVDDPVPGGMYLLNLDDNKLTPYGINYVESAWVHQGYLYYSDLDGDVFVRNFHRRVDEKIAENKPLPQLNGKAMFIQGEFIYSVDQTDFMLNQYGSQGQLVKAMMQLKPTAWKVTGLKGNKLLLSQFIAIDHDIVMIE